MPNLDGDSLGENAADHHEAAIEFATAEQGDYNIDTAAAAVATVAVVGVAALVFEAAPIPGLCLGVAAMLVPKFLPRLGTALKPLVKSMVHGAYRVGRKTREPVAEAEEHVQDIVAEVDAEAEPADRQHRTPDRARAGRRRVRAPSTAGATDVHHP